MITERVCSNVQPDMRQYAAPTQKERPESGPTLNLNIAWDVITAKNAKQSSDGRPVKCHFPARLWSAQGSSNRCMHLIFKIGIEFGTE